LAGAGIRTWHVWHERQEPSLALDRCALTHLLFI